MFNDEIIAHGKPFNVRKATTDHWYDVAIGNSNCHLSITLVNSESFIGLELYIDNNKNLFDALYKYKDDIFPFHDNSQGTTITLTFQMDDEPGILSDVLKIIAEYRANILTIHQSILINGIASLTLSIQVLQTTGDISRMIEQLEGQTSVHHVKILAKE